MGKITEEYRKRNPYHVWVYRDDGSKFVGHFRNKRDAMDWSRRTGDKYGTKLGKVTTASHKKGPRKSTGFGLGLFR